MPILHPHREAAKLVLTGLVIAIAGVYTIRKGTTGDYLQKFAWWGRRRYTSNPQAADRRLYHLIGAFFLLIGVIAVGVGVHTLVAR